jgi:hypothetical protein
MRYLVYSDDLEAFYTNVFNWVSGCEMVVFDLYKHLLTVDGITWNDINFDQL